MSTTLEWLDEAREVQQHALFADIPAGLAGIDALAYLSGVYAGDPFDDDEDDDDDDLDDDLDDDDDYDDDEDEDDDEEYDEDDDDTDPFVDIGGEG